MASKTSVHLSSLPSSSSPHLQHHSKKQSLSKKRAESPPPPPVPTAIAKAREDISLRCLQRHDSAIRRIVCQAAFVSVYALSEDTKKWDRAHMQGGLHVVERDISCSLLEEEEEGGRGGEQEKRGTSEDDEEEERREFKRKGREGWQNNSSKRKDKKEDSSSSSFPTSSFSSRIRWRLFVLNQRDTDILVENLDESFEMEGEKNHIFYRVTDQHTGSQRIQAIWVYDDKQRLAVQQALQSIIDECKLRRNFSHLPPLLSSTSCSSSSAAFSSSSLPARSSPAGEGKTGESQPGVVAPSGEDLRLYPEGAFSSSSF
ncbi:mrna decapping enzyme, partial [Cystoisospora suis]